MDYLADTVFLIDLWRESQSPGRATAFARTHAGKQVGICWVVAGEFLSGAVAAQQDQVLVKRFLSNYSILHSSLPVIASYAELYADLRSRNRLIGPNDLWIAATALAHGLPVLTRNTKEFSRIKSLQLVDYTDAAHGE